MSDYKNKMCCVSIVARWFFSVLHFACAIQEPVESSVICLQGSCQKPCSLFESNKTSSHRSRAEPLDCLKAAESKLSKYQFYTLLHSRKVLSLEIQRVLRRISHQLWYSLVYIIWRPKIFFFIVFVTTIMFRIENITLLFKDFFKLSQFALIVFGESKYHTGVRRSLETLELTQNILPPHSSNLKQMLMCVCSTVPKTSELLPT